MRRFKLGGILLAIICCLLISGCGCSKKKFIVTFDTDGGSKIKSVEVYKGKTVAKPKNPTKEGYTFDNWYLNGKKYDFKKPVNENITLKAKWIKKSDAEEYFTIKFDTNGGNIIDSIKVIKNGKIDGSLPIPTKEGYIFEGWYLNGVKFTSETIVTSDITLVAKWTKKSSSNNSQTSSDGSTGVQKPSDDNGNGEDTKPLTAKFTVKFDTQGGSTIISQIVESGKLAIKPINPVKDGYTFAGWFLNGVEFNFNTKIVSDITLVAKWNKVEDTYTFEFVPYSDYLPIAGSLKIYKNNEITPIEFIEILDANGRYLGKYNSEDKGMRNANEYIVDVVKKVKLIDGTIVDITEKN